VQALLDSAKPCVAGLPVPQPMRAVEDEIRGRVDASERPRERPIGIEHAGMIEAHSRTRLGLSCSAIERFAFQRLAYRRDHESSQLEGRSPSCDLGRGIVAKRATGRPKVHEDRTPLQIGIFECLAEPEIRRSEVRQRVA
jgi:hypothetical protein